MRADTDSDSGNRRLPGEDDFNEETKEFLAVLRSIPPVPEEDDPNDWFQQFYDHLKRSPQQRMERWAWFVDGALRYQKELRGRPHVKFDPVRVLRTLTAGGVVFVVVGMGAGYLQGRSLPVLQHQHHTEPGPYERGEARCCAGVAGRPTARVGRVGTCHGQHYGRISAS